MNRFATTAIIAALAVPPLAVAAVAVPAAAASGASVPCDAPALFETEHHDMVPAVEKERLVTPALEAVFQTVVTREAWSEKIEHPAVTIDHPATEEQGHWRPGDLITPAQPAVTVIVREYSNRPATDPDHPSGGDEQGHEERWIADGDHVPGGFHPTGATREEVVTPAQEAVFGPDEWVVDTEAQPGWVETVTDAWTETVEYPAITEKQLVTPARDALYETVVVNPAVPASDEQVLVTPAGEACEEPPSDEKSPAFEPHAVTSPVTQPVADTIAPAAGRAPQGGVLPNTGGPMIGLLIAALALIGAGAGILRRRMR